MATPSFGPNLHSRYPDLRQVLAATSRMPALPPSLQPKMLKLNTNRSASIIAAVKDAKKSVTAGEVGRQIGVTANYVANWFRLWGAKHGIVCVGTAPGPTGIAPKLWEFQADAVPA